MSFTCIIGFGRFFRSICKLKLSTHAWRSNTNWKEIYNENICEKCDKKQL